MNSAAYNSLITLSVAYIMSTHADAVTQRYENMWKKHKMHFLPISNKVIISSSVDTRSLGSDVRFGDDHFT